MASLPPTGSERTTVLVVDDEDGIRKALDRFLTRIGYQVSAAANASEALARLAADRPQAMLSTSACRKRAAWSSCPRCWPRTPTSP
jgi:DNA-binding NtrC family response regulator